MRLRLLNFLTVLSLVLFLALAAMCARPEKYSGTGLGIDTWRPNRTTIVHHRVGLIVSPRRTQWQHMCEVFYGWDSAAEPPPDPDRLVAMGCEGGDSAWTLLPTTPVGLEWGGERIAEGSYRIRYFRWAAVPTWLTLLVLAALPSWRLRSALARRRLSKVGHCRRCGYDLRATPGRCPECGTTL
jgi:hypothetical protein